MLLQTHNAARAKPNVSFIRLIYKIPLRNNTEDNILVLFRKKKNPLFNDPSTITFLMFILNSNTDFIFISETKCMLLVSLSFNKL